MKSELPLALQPKLAGMLDSKLLLNSEWRKAPSRVRRGRPMEDRHAKSLAEIDNNVPEGRPALVTPKLTRIVLLRSSKYEGSIDSIPPQD